MLHIMRVHHQKPPWLINEASREVPQPIKWPLEAGAKSASIPPQTRLFKVFHFGGNHLVYSQLQKLGLPILQ